ncbi:MAG: cyclic pyranopterin monophosphate synthase MoaC [Pedosphaera sp.]|nr:cyclic pyranopterin monophosphate synthase MoaC [Pedosphaera sp.]
MTELSHIDDAGRAAMVDVSAKPAQLREAVASGRIELSPETISLIQQSQITKGDVLATARLAGILAAKKTAELIPLCHPLALTHVAVDFEWSDEPSALLIRGTARTQGPTGVEMEALTAVSLAALTIYDMCKAVDKTMRITDIRLESKTKQ